MPAPKMLSAGRESYRFAARYLVILYMCTGREEALLECAAEHRRYERSLSGELKLEFHDVDTDTDFLARILARMSVSVSLSAS